MTPEEVREKIAQRIFELYYAHLPPSKDWTKACLGLTDEILVILKKAGYVQLHPDQKLPLTPYANPRLAAAYNAGVIEGREQGWRRVIL